MNCWLSKSHWYGWFQGAALILTAVLGMWLLPRLGLAPAWAQASYFFHEVKPGETLWSISRAYGTSVERLEEFNGGERVGHSIKSGEFLVIPAEMLVVAQKMAVSPEALHKASAADAVLPDEVFAAPVRPSSVYGEDETVAILPGSVFGSSQASPAAEGEGVAPSAVILGESPAASPKPQAPASGKGKAAPASGSKASSAAPKAASDKGLVAVAPASVFVGSTAAPSGAGQKTASSKPSGAQGQKANSAQAGGQPKAQDKGKAPAKDAPKAQDKGKTPAKDATKAQDKGKAPAKDATKAQEKGKAPAKDAPKAQDKGKAPVKDANKAQDKGQSAASGITWHKPQEGKPSSDGAKAGAKGKPSGQGQATKSVDEMLAFARKFIGTPYVYGGDTPAGFDCSGYVQSVCRYAGVRIPRVADEQYYKAGRPIPKGQEQAGDLVFFETDPSWPGPSHVGICLGGGEFIHASSSGSVRVDKLSKDYYRTRFLGSKRVIEQS